MFFQKAMNLVKSLLCFATIMAGFRVEVGYIERKNDATAAGLKHAIEEDLQVKGIESLDYIDV